MAEQSETAAQEETDGTTSEDSTTPAKKTTAKKSTATKTTAKKSAPKKRAVSTAKKAAPAKEGSGSSDNGSRSSSGSGRRLNAVTIARAAREQLAELLNKDSETVIGVQRTDDGWEVDIEIVETRRIPDTTDVLAIYRVELDDDGEIEGYERLERYIRGKTEGGGTRG